MDEPPQGPQDGSVSNTSKPISPPSTTNDYSTEKQLDDRIHTTSPLDPAAQAPEVVQEASHTDQKDGLNSVTSTTISTEKQFDSKKDGLSHSKTDDTQFSTEKQHLGAVDEETSPKYPTLHADQPGLEHTTNALADEPEPFAGCRTIEPEENIQTELRSQRPPVDETSWHTGFWDCCNPASLCICSQFLSY
jgi:hypothetical protein